ncbi:hypothetical protein L226DRAFT_559412 [Lentinus tigrinus ALCF2SS1-7]|uniref:MYND-type domain-containing protein n=1 Tax=Lentinus tigrinus ALCF2SS1-6 TaxID=1328759 RepID=A0A5C2SJN5_9APHY|nr:hypothetical protein L227DRAFT_560860 [Lentinus tigrinus ALCF2SS1-6]RPD76277.1 hypothetical protein L226DRAFT_559412 [Lentinus tigrinus ALCF2SS1-7]
MDNPLKDYRTILGDSTQCDACGAQGYKAYNKLRKCGGCSLAVYCSKECQRKAWPTHKSWCRTRDRGVNPNAVIEQWARMRVDLPDDCTSRIEDFSCRATVVADFHKFADYHRRTLEHIAIATLFLNMTPTDAELLRRGELLLCMDLTPIRTVKAGSSRGPAHSWLLCNLPQLRAVQDELVQPEFASVWSAQAMQSKIVDDAYRGRFGSEYGGLCFIVYRVGVAQEFQQMPVLLPKNPAALSKASTKDALTDYMRFLKGCLNCGVVLQTSKEDEVVAQPGELHLVKTRSKETWTWRPVPVPWPSVHREISRCSGYTPKSGMSPPQLMKFFASL